MKHFLYLLKMEFLVNDEEFRNWKIIIYLSILAMIMIASGHATDRKIFKIAQLNEELKKNSSNGNDLILNKAIQELNTVLDLLKRNRLLSMNPMSDG